MELSQTLLMISGAVIAMLLAIFKLQRLRPVMIPFVIYLIVGVANELVSMYTSRSIRNTAWNNNAFMLLECLLLTWQFKNWGSSSNSKKWYLAMGLFTILFAWEMTTRGMGLHSYYFNICYCFFLSLCATHRLAERAFSVDRVSYRDKRFFICTGILIYFLCRLLLESFWHYGAMQSTGFRNAVLMLMVWLNFFVNLLYIIAIVWTRRKPTFITA